MPPSSEHGSENEEERIEPLEIVEGDVSSNASEDKAPNGPAKRAFAKRQKAPKKLYQKALDAMYERPWLKVGDGVPISIKEFQPPVSVNLPQILNWLFDVPGAVVDDSTYEILFAELCKCGGDAIWQTMSVKASQILKGDRGQNLSQWLRTNSSITKRFSNALDPHERVHYKELTDLIPRVVGRLRDVMSVVHHLASIYQYSKNCSDYFDIGLPELGGQLLVVTVLTVSSYRTYLPQFDFVHCVLEEILQRYLLVRRTSSTRLSMPPVAVRPNFHLQDVQSTLTAVWDEMYTGHSAVEACLKMSEKELEVCKTGRTTHTGLKAWVKDVCKRNGIELGRKFTTTSPIYMRVTDALSRKLHISIQSKFTIGVIIKCESTLKTGRRPARSSLPKTNKKHTTHPDQDVLSAQKHTPDEHESSAASEAQAHSGRPAVHDDVLNHAENYVTYDDGY